MKKDYLLNKVINRSLRDMSATIPKKEADCIDIDYNFNSYGYRCNEFNNQEVLILGCSQTEGHGMPLELTWPYLLSKKMNKDYVNLAKGGDGAQAQITKAFQFFKEFYNPKYILAVFPLPRLEIPLINLRAGNSSNIEGIAKGMFSKQKILKYSKGPHDVEGVIPPDFAIFYNILFIKMLIQYCEINDIKFIWTVYDDDNINYLSIDQLHKGYFNSMHFLENKDFEKEKCHSEFSDQEFFNHAADYKFWPPGHWGLHKHLHMAESMYNML